MLAARGAKPNLQENAVAGRADVFAGSCGRASGRSRREQRTTDACPAAILAQRAREASSARSVGYTLKRPQPMTRPAAGPSLRRTL